MRASFGTARIRADVGGAIGPDEPLCEDCRGIALWAKTASGGGPTLVAPDRLSRSFPPRVP